MQEPRITLQTELVLQALLVEPSQRRYGLEICQLVGLPSGTVYPILARLERVGWIESSWEDPEVHEAAGRARRRFYRVASGGAELAKSALARSYRAKKKPHPLWNPLAGPLGGIPCTGGAS
jgi:DNA-binding PadR family transcriptional regulator